MLEYAEKIEELLDEACDNLSPEMFYRLLELIEDSINNYK